MDSSAKYAIRKYFGIVGKKEAYRLSKASVVKLVDTLDSKSASDYVSQAEKENILVKPV